MNSKLQRFFAVVWGVLISTAAVADPQATYAGTYPIKAVATTGIIADVVSRIGGDFVRTQALLPPGEDPHQAKINAQRTTLLSNSDIIFHNGVHLEGKISDTIKNISKKIRSFAIAEKIDQRYLMRSGELSGQYDPHFWMDVSLWMKAADKIKEELSTFDPSHADAYSRNFTAYRADLTALHQYATSVLRSIPEDARVLITPHDGFNYFGRAYDIEVRGIQGINTSSVAGLKDISVLAEYVVTKKLPAVFLESTTSEKNIRALVQSAKGYELPIAGTLYSDAVGTVGTREATYVGMMAHNIDLVAKALGGSVPSKGFVSLSDIRQSKNPS